MKLKIGLETHVQLNTRSKIFCECANPLLPEKEPGPNTLTCETCLGMPGSKPVTNREVVEAALRVALALGSRISPEIFFSRKTYFYPDMSKNFQITQYEVPLARGGHIEIGGKKKIRIRRVHVEEDPAKLVHVGGLGGKHVLVDYNRSGIPLMEIVTEPDFSSPEEAREFLHKLEIILEYLGVYDSASRAVMKSDANISIAGGARVEVKNITGTKDIEQALKYEIIRQRNMMGRGLEVRMSTRSWNPDLGVTEELRGKEEEEEYGYIFEPDLTRIEIQKALVEREKKSLPELPDQKLSRFIKQYKISGKMAESLVSELEIAELFEWVAKKLSPRLAGSWISGYLKKTLNWHNIKFRQSGLRKEWVLETVRLYGDGKLTDRNAELVIRKMVEESRPPETIIRKHKLAKLAKPGELKKFAEKVLKANPKAAEDYSRGEVKALHFLVGQVVRESKGRLDANDVRKTLVKMLR